MNLEGNIMMVSPRILFQPWELIISRLVTGSEVNESSFQGKASIRIPAPKCLTTISYWLSSILEKGLHSSV